MGSQKAKKTAAYFFAEMPNEMAMWAGMADIIREISPDLPLVFIMALQPRSRDLEWDTILSRFDEVHEVSYCGYTAGIGRSTNDLFSPKAMLADFGRALVRQRPRGVGRILTQGFAEARQTAAELRELRFQPNSVAFVNSAVSLVTNMFLKRVRSELNVRTVLLAERRNVSLNDFIFDYKESLFRNLHLHFWGTAHLDCYIMRTFDSAKTIRVEYRFRERPADFLFSLVHPANNPSLGPGEVYYPLYQRDRPPSRAGESVAFFGQPYREPLIAQEPAYRRLNELLNVIREKHATARLIYKPHTGEPKQIRDYLNLEGFEVVSSVSSEALLLQDPSISTAYSVFSNSTLTAMYYGARGYFLYHLFEDDAIPTIMKQRLDTQWPTPVYPETHIKSVDDWMNGKVAYDPQGIPKHVRDSTLSILSTAGVLDMPDGGSPKSTLAVTEERWADWPGDRPSSRVLRWAAWVATKELSLFGLWFLGLPFRRLGHLFSRSRRFVTGKVRQKARGEDA